VVSISNIIYIFFYILCFTEAFIGANHLNNLRRVELWFALENYPGGVNDMEVEEIEVNSDSDESSSESDAIDNLEIGSQKKQSKPSSGSSSGASKGPSPALKGPSPKVKTSQAVPSKRALETTPKKVSKKKKTK
jgi:hypothetical protein